MLEPAFAGAVPEDPAVSPSAGLARIRTRVLGHSSFAGTSPSGDWCVSDGTLRPCQGLRQRFEYYLLALGIVPAGDIRALVDDEARRAQGDRIAGEIMSIWDRYLALRSKPLRAVFDQNDRSTWMPVFEERQALRRQIMGIAWADAFFAEEERHFRDYSARLDAGEPPAADPGAPVPRMSSGHDPEAVRAERVARYGQAGADRLAAADAAWADWERRLGAARAEKARLMGDGQLSDVQRLQAMQAHVAARFTAEETKRVKALLDLP